MRPFTADELARMRATQTASMFDECRLIRLVESGTTARGYPQQEEFVLMTTACGFDPAPSREVYGGAQVVEADAVVRLPHALAGALQQTDRIRITKRQGEMLPPEEQPVYEVIGKPERGPTALVVPLALSTEGRS